MSSFPPAAQRIPSLTRAVACLPERWNENIPRQDTLRVDSQRKPRTPAPRRRATRKNNRPVIYPPSMQSIGIAVFRLPLRTPYLPRRIGAFAVRLRVLRCILSHGVSVRRYANANFRPQCRLSSMSAPQRRNVRQQAKPTLFQSVIFPQPCTMLGAEGAANKAVLKGGPSVGKQLRSICADANGCSEATILSNFPIKERWRSSNVGDSIAASASYSRDKLSVLSGGLNGSSQHHLL
jgi:hypothetical protein